MSTPLPPNPLDGLWLAQFTGLAALAELPAQLLAGTAYGALAGTPQALAARLAGQAELVRQFVADWRPVLAAVAEAEDGAWRAVLAPEAEALAQRLLASLRAGSELALQGLAAFLAAWPAAEGRDELLAALAALAEAYQRIAAATLRAFAAELANYLEAHALASHEPLLRLWLAAAAQAHGAALAGELPAAYGRCLNAYDRWFAGLQTGAGA